MTNHHLINCLSNNHYNTLSTTSAVLSFLNFNNQKEVSELGKNSLAPQTMQPVGKVGGGKMKRAKHIPARVH